jgi:ABC-2 type transport system ATP-binding protein
VHELERICDHIGVVDQGRMIAELRMEEFRNGIRRIRLVQPAGVVTDTPFHLHSRRASLGREEEWIVQGWRDELRSWFDVNRIEVREIVHLDLEECFVELLGGARTTTEAA